VYPLEYPFLDITSINDLENANLRLLELEKPSFWKSIFLENIGEYTLHVGIDTSAIEKIVEYSQDQHDIALSQNTGDKERFSDKQKFLKWYSDAWRFLFSLMDANGEIAWIWYGRPSLAPEIITKENKELCMLIEKNSDKIHTWGIRIYPNARWKWLATPLIQRSSYYYRHIFPDAYMSIDIDEWNIASQKAYEKSWYIYIWLWENRKTIEKNAKERKIYLELPE
jgi:RimJ/RimL family protein N-acetyltransferase